MKLRLISDLHFEFYEDKELYKNKGEDVLIIAGDLAVGKHTCWSALKQFADHTEHVIFVPGNHECYRQDMGDFDYTLKDWSKGTNIHFLNPSSIKVGDVTFIGATLWTNFANNAFSKIACARSINDFRVINNFSVDKCSALYTEHEKFIKEAYNLPGKKVIVTHFLPDRACIAPEYRGESAINDYFANNLGNWIQDLKDTPYWLFGHTHTPMDIMIGDTRVIANPYGYNRNHNYKEIILEA